MSIFYLWGYFHATQFSDDLSSLQACSLVGGNSVAHRLLIIMYKQLKDVPKVLGEFQQPISQWECKEYADAAYEKKKSYLGRDSSYIFLQFHFGN